MIKNGFSIILFFLLSFSDAIAQRFLSLPFAGYDEEARVQVGFQYNYVNQKYQIILKNNWQGIIPTISGEDNLLNEETPVSAPEIMSIYSDPTHGFSIGIPIDVRWNDRMTINFTPSFNILNAHRIIYSSRDYNTDRIIRKSKHVLRYDRGDNFNSFEFPIAFKLLSDIKKISSSDTRYRGYMLGGVRLTRWIGIQKYYDKVKLDVDAGQSIPETIILRPEFISLEAGVGFDIIISYFKISPEIRFSQSINNVLSNNHALARNNNYMAPIDKGYIRNVYFSLIFQ